MNPFVSFAKLDTKRKVLYLKVLGSLLMVRLTLAFRGYSHFRNKAFSKTPERIGVNPTDLARIVKVQARLVPGATCLTQAITLHRLLHDFGHDSTIRVGVKAEEKSSLKAHAWVISENEVILGDEDVRLSDYSVLTDL